MTTIMLIEVLVSCSDGPVCSSVRVNNTGIARQYNLTKFALQESECLRNSNREATKLLAERDLTMLQRCWPRVRVFMSRRCVSVCERLLAFQRHCRPSKLRGVNVLLHGTTSQPTLTSEVFTPVASARLTFWTRNYFFNFSIPCT
jgi:hypothetical protein